MVWINFKLVKNQNFWFLGFNYWFLEIFEGLNFGPEAENTTINREYGNWLGFKVVFGGGWCLQIPKIPLIRQSNSVLILSEVHIWAYLTNSFSVTDGICTDFSKFNQVNSIFSGCHLAQGYFWTQFMLSTAHFVHTI